MIDADAAIAALGTIFQGATEGTVFLTSLGPNGAVRSLMTREADRIEEFLQRQDQPGAGRGASAGWRRRLATRRSPVARRATAHMRAPPRARAPPRPAATAPAARRRTTADRLAIQAAAAAFEEAVRARDSESRVMRNR